MEPTVVDIPAGDGYCLGGRHFASPDEVGEKVLIINSAMGVPQRFYGKFAAYMAQHGYEVITYDYRGIGGSRPASLIHFPYRYQDWGERDLEGVITWARREFPQAQLTAMGHSAGGQLMGFAPGHRHLKGLVFVASQSGYWKLWPGVHKWWMFLLWHVAVPLFTRLYGYFPGYLMGGEDIPRGVVHQWAQWGRHPRYLLSSNGDTEEKYREVKMPILSWSFSDDNYCPRPTVAELLTFYPSAPSEHRHRTPKDVEVKAIGHFNFFRPKFEKTLWRETRQWLDETLTSSDKY